jgi:3-hydroxybutyryl-CoA dehydrogenase
MKLADIKKVACLGTGTMGPGVAFLSAKAGYDVTMFGRSPASIERGFKAVDAAIKIYVDNGLMPAELAPTVRGKIKGVTTLEEAAQDADLVIESVAEVMEIKQEVFQKVEKLCKPHAVLGTDTSGLSPSKIASALARPEQFVVIHFVNPPHLIPAVEIVPCSKTLPEVKQLAVDWVRFIGHKPIEVEREIPGFILNRLQFACLREALYIVDQGWAKPEAVDAIMRYSLGRRYPVTGPIETADLGGLDIFCNISKYLNRELCSSGEVSPFLLQTVESGNLGAKTGQGLYKWSPEEIAQLRAAREKELIEWLKKDQAVK